MMKTAPRLSAVMPVRVSCVRVNWTLLKTYPDGLRAGAGGVMGPKPFRTPDEKLQIVL